MAQGHLSILNDYQCCCRVSSTGNLAIVGGSNVNGILFVFSYITKKKLEPGAIFVAVKCVQGAQSKLCRPIGRAEV